MRTWVADVGGPLHVAAFGDRGPVIVVVHSLGGSHANWRIIAEILSTGARVLCPDLPGAGRTPLAGRPATVQAHQAVLDGFLRDVVGEPAVLVGNSMGAMLALGATARQSELVTGLALVNPWLPRLAAGAYQGASSFTLRDKPRMARAMVSTRRAALSPEAAVLRTLRLVCADPRRVPRQTIDAAIQIATERKESGDDGGLVQALESLLEAAGDTEFWRAAVAKVAVPTLLAHGTADRLVPADVVEQVRAARPDWRFAALGGTGHSPQLEEPVWLAYLLRRWLEQDLGLPRSSPPEHSATVLEEQIWTGSSSYELTAQDRP